MRSNRLFDRSSQTFTHLFARISEEEIGYVVQFRLNNDAKPENGEWGAWGEEIVDSFEGASQMVSALAAEFSIFPTRIKIEIRMSNLTEGTRH